MVPGAWSRWRYCTPIAVISGSLRGLVRVSVVVTVDSILKLGSSTACMPSKTRLANFLQTSAVGQHCWKRAAGIQLIFTGSAVLRQRTTGYRLQQASYSAE